MSDYIGRRVLMRGAHGDWWDGLCSDMIEEDGFMKYVLNLDNGDVLKICVDDICEILETRKTYRAGQCAVIPFRRERKRG
jgi:hypothetical protein